MGERRNISLVLLPFIVLAACVDEYNHTGLSGLENVLVIDALITEGEFTVRLSRSVPLQDEFTGLENVAGAEVYVECSDGTRSEQAKNVSRGRYSVYCDKLDLDKKYRLVVKSDGEIYASEFLSPMTTSEIEHITMEKKAPGEPVIIKVSTKVTVDGSGYYGWKLREHWEVHSEVIAVVYVIPKEELQLDDSEEYFWRDSVCRYDLNTENNITHCWGLQNTESLILGSSARLSVDKISSKIIKEIDPTDPRLSILYYVEADQFGLRETAYNYFEATRKNSDRRADIFAPVFSEIPGNITCLTDSSIPVIGYVEVSRKNTRGEFFPFLDKIYEPLVKYCPRDTIKRADDYMIYDQKWLSDESEEPINLDEDFPLIDKYKWAPEDCVDCRKKPYASKNKPTWWTTENL